MHTNIQRVRSSREYPYPGSWFLSEEEKEARGGGRLIVRKEEAPPFASHRSLARFASSTVKIIIFFFIFRLKKNILNSLKEKKKHRFVSARALFINMRARVLLRYPNASSNHCDRLRHEPTTYSSTR